MLIPRLGQRRSEMTLEYLFVLEKKEVFRECWGHITRNQYQLKGLDKPSLGEQKHHSLPWWSASTE